MTPPPDSPSVSEMLEELSIFPIGLVVAATILPGLTICIPGLILGAAFILVPLAAIALVLVVVGAVVASPFLIVRGIHALVERHAEKAQSVVPVSFTPPRFATAAVQRLTAEAPLHPQPHRSTTVGR